MQTQMHMMHTFPALETMSLRSDNATSFEGSSEGDFVPSSPALSSQCSEEACPPQKLSLSQHTARFVRYEPYAVPDGSGVISVGCGGPAEPVSLGGNVLDAFKITTSCKFLMAGFKPVITDAPIPQLCKKVFKTRCVRCSGVHLEDSIWSNRPALLRVLGSRQLSMICKLAERKVEKMPVHQARGILCTMGLVVDSSSESASASEGGIDTSREDLQKEVERTMSFLQENPLHELGEVGLALLRALFPQK